MIGPIGREEFDDRQTDDLRQTDDRQQTDDKQTEKSSPSVPYDAFACFAGLIIIIITRQVLGRPVCDRGVIPRTLVQWNVVRSRLIILINEEINKANWMVSNSAKLDRRTKQHTQFGVSASNGSRDMARTKSWRKKQKK